NVKGIVKLECDLCLKEFEHHLDFEIDELYAKRALIEGSDEHGQEIEIKDGQFVTDLNGEDEIDIYDLLYQSVILELPNKKVCGINCKEDFFEKDDSFTVPDNRMDVFKTIKIEK
ncbi:MAG: YceD family protein, partial [Candidatus Gastranaerophilaceae bacterium]